MGRFCEILTPDSADVSANFMMENYGLASEDDNKARALKIVEMYGM